MFRFNLKFPFCSPLLRFAGYNTGGTAAEVTELHTSKLTEQSHFLWFGVLAVSMGRRRKSLHCTAV